MVPINNPLSLTCMLWRLGFVDRQLAECVAVRRTLPFALFLLSYCDRDQRCKDREVE